MRVSALLFLAACAALPASASAFAADGEGIIHDWQTARRLGQASWQVRIDNDSLLLNRDDGFYTSGAEIGQAWLLSRGGATLVAGWRLGQQFYTASDIKLPPEKIGPPDHPYAGWLYFGGFRETHDPDGSYLRLSLDLGCLGPCAGGEWTQKNLHHLISQPQPQGWSKQVKNEAGVVAAAHWQPMRWRPSAEFEVAPGLHGRIGNIHTDTGASLLVRAGRLGHDGDVGDHAYGFLRLDASAVAYNATLQGGLFSSGNPHVVKPKRAVGEVEAGLAWQSGRFGLAASVTRRGNEIDGLANSRGAQNFVRLDLRLTQ